MWLKYLKAKFALCIPDAMSTSLDRSKNRLFFIAQIVGIITHEYVVKI